MPRSRFRTKRHQRLCRPWAKTTILLSILLLSARSAHAAVNTHAVFLEKDIRVAWAALLGADKNNGSSEWDATGGGSRGVVNAMLADCHGRKSGAWGAECDRALYLKSVLNKIDDSSAASTSIDAASASDDEAQLESSANDVAVVSGAHLPFSAFFHEYAVPRRPVILSESSGSDYPVDQTSSEEQGYSSDDHRNPADQQDKRHGVRTDGGLLGEIDACLPYPVDPTGAAAVTAAGPLRACPDALLGNLLVPLHVSEDFVQRFRARDVLPIRDHAEVEHFVSG